MNLVLVLEILEEHVQQMQFSRFPLQCIWQIYFGTIKSQHNKKNIVKWNTIKIGLTG